MAVLQDKNTRFALPLICPKTGETVSAETLYNRCCEAVGYTVRDHIGDLIFDNLDYSADHDVCATDESNAALHDAVYAWAKDVRATISAERAPKGMEGAFANGRSWYQDICQLVAGLENEDEREAAEQQIQEGPLSIMVRDGWRSPGAEQRSGDGPEEYEILLSTGGPALRIWGKIGDHNEPSTAELQAQDWGTPWTRVPDCDEAVLLAYAQCFYFG